MPVSDVNAPKMAEAFFSTIDSLEFTTDFWNKNPQPIAWIFIMIILLCLVLGAFAFGFWIIGGHLRKR